MNFTLARVLRKREWKMDFAIGHRLNGRHVVDVRTKDEDNIMLKTSIL